MQVSEAILVVVCVLVVLEFYRRLRWIEVKVDKLLSLHGAGAQGESEPSTQVIALVAAGKKIEAMRLYRQESGADLKRAMKVVEAVSSASSPHA